MNACISHHRQLAVRRSYMEHHGREEPTADLPDVEGRDAIVRAVRALPPRQRAAIVLRYWADLSESDMAATMGCSVQAVRNLLQRGLSTLRSTSEVQR